MNKLRISVAVGDYDRTRPLVDGRVLVDGADPVYMLLTPEEMFFRSMRHESFDVCELSFSSYAVRTLVAFYQQPHVEKRLIHFHYRSA